MKAAWARAMTLGLLTTLLGLLVAPIADDAERDLGLAWLFRLRGPLPAPTDAVVVNVDQASFRQLGLSNNPFDSLLVTWPRSLHARLVNTLAMAGARVIAFDVIFDQPQHPRDDGELAAAIRAAGNVVLLEHLDPYLHDAGNGPSLLVQTRLPPIAELAEAAAAIAPFPLPKAPVTSQCWLFKQSAGDVPTMPVVAFQLHAGATLNRLLDELRALVPPASSQGWENLGPAELARQLFLLFQADPGLRDRVLARPHGPASKASLAALMDLYGGHATRYINFYGPPGTIITIPYHQLLKGSPGQFDLRGKTVFVGFSEQVQPKQSDVFRTVFSDEDGFDIGGVEIAATVFANLLQQRFVEPLDYRHLLLALGIWGFAVGALCLLVPLPLMPPVLLALIGAYLGLAHTLFSQAHLWSPIVVPLLAQLPFAVVVALGWRYRHTHRKQREIRTIFGHYLPIDVVDELTREGRAGTASVQEGFGVCLNTDAAQYTHFSERHAPQRLHHVLNSYYEVLFAPVQRHGGLIADVVGDAMLAVWATPQAPIRLRQRACAAAVDILAAVEAFNSRQPESGLPTRIGLHCGELALCHVGASDHYEYRVVGDIVNTTTRIQELNKYLGTRVLASREVAADLPLFTTRELGAFRLAGKSGPLIIHELLGPSELFEIATEDHRRRFAAALAAFQAQRWREAAELFRAVLVENADDGAARFYLRLCRRHQDDFFRDGWDGVINVRRTKEADLGRQDPRERQVPLINPR